MSGTRERIIEAATAIVREGATTGPSVRAVAGRAGVGASTLRHYFPTQRDLRDAVLRHVYRDALPDERIGDRGLPAEERLAECLGNLLEPFGEVEQAREIWRQLFRTLIEEEPDAGVSAGYRTIAGHTTDRVEAWLAVLDQERRSSADDRRARADFLLAVVDGLALDRALPTRADAAAERALLLNAARVALDLPVVWSSAASG